MQTILITGANGFVGHYLTQQLINENYRVVATGKGPGRFDIKNKNFLYETMDFTNEESVKAVFQQYKPAIVVHLGAMSKPDDCELNKESAFLTNVTGTLYCLQQAQSFKSFFIFLSSDFVFSGTKLNYKEDDKPNPVNYYGQTKLLAEQEVKKYAGGWSIVRTILVYGHPKSGRQNILTNVASALKKGEALNIVDDQTRTPTYVEDLVSAIATIVKKKSTGIFHISGEDILTPYQMACAVADYLHLDSKKINKVTAGIFKEPAKRPPTTGFDLTKAKNELDYKPTSFKKGLQKTFED